MVHPDEEREGIGHELMERAIEYIRKQGAEESILLFLCTELFSSWN